jgi:hypothetical protein
LELILGFGFNDAPLVGPAPTTGEFLELGLLLLAPGAAAAPPPTLGVDTIAQMVEELGRGDGWILDGDREIRLLYHKSIMVAV